jgi:hypothetical protein
MRAVQLETVDSVVFAGSRESVDAAGPPSLTSVVAELVCASGDARWPITKRAFTAEATSPMKELLRLRLW